MALWRKESTRKDALYVDLFNQQRHIDDCLKSVYNETKSQIEIAKSDKPWRKDNTVAINLRRDGDTYFTLANYRKAMEIYNESLCFAEPGTEHISLGYANRSNCFYKLKMYDRCIDDIFLAKKGKCTPIMIDMLNKCFDKCMEFINEGDVAYAHKPKLCCPANKQIPVFSNSIKIEFDERRGQRVVATENLNAGQTFMVEPVYVGELFTEKYKSCSICLKYNQNLIPCKDCTVAMFCDGKCDLYNIHQYECTIKQCWFLSDSLEVNTRIPLIRTILLAMRIFPSIDVLIKFVERTMASGSLDIPKWVDAKSKYQAFLKLKIDEASSDRLPMVYSTYTTMMEQPKIAEIFHTEKYRRFLMHLILHHYLVLGKNNSQQWTTSAQNDEVTDAMTTMYLSILKSSFRHSCARNITLYLDNGSLVGKILRPTKKGEELCQTIGLPLPDAYSVRRRLLWKVFQIKCCCEYCVTRAEHMPEDHSLTVHEDFRSIRELSNAAMDEKLDESAKDSLHDKCVSFLQRFGRNPWSVELDLVTLTYELLLTTRCETKRIFPARQGARK